MEQTIGDIIDSELNNVNVLESKFDNVNIKAETSYHLNERKVIFLSVASIFISITSLCIAIIRCEPVRAEWATILIGILAILVTLLVGWQIYTIISAETKFRILQKVVNETRQTVDEECSKLSTAVYSTIFEEKFCEGTDIKSIFKYGLLIIIHAQNMGDVGYCKSMIKVLTQLLPTVKTIRNQDKANILTLANKISESPIKDIFSCLHGKIITQLKSADNE